MLFPFHDDVPTRRTPIVMIALIVMNVVVFLWLSKLPSIEQDAVACRWGFVPARVHQFFSGQPIEIPLVADEPAATWPWFAPPPRQIVLPADRPQILLSLLTCMFLHGGWLHLIGNMWFLWIFGDNVEDRLGHVPFLLFYFVGGLLASAAHWLASGDSLTPVIGASGAIAAVLGAYSVTWPWARVRTLLFLFIFVTIVELPALLVLGFLVPCPVCCRGLRGQRRRRASGLVGACGRIHRRRALDAAGQRPAGCRRQPAAAPRPLRAHCRPARLLTTQSLIPNPFPHGPPLASKSRSRLGPLAVTS